MSDNDFFTSVPFSAQQSRTHPTDQENVVSFAQAIASRFGSSDLLTARLLPDEQQQPSSHQPISIPNQQQLSIPSHSPIKSIDSTTFTPVTPQDLPSYLADPSTLILDIRPHATYTAARIHRAISLSIPSTLLKRPLFGLSKLVQMLPSQSARSRFAVWPTATQILVYDADSISVPDTSNIAGLLRKFRAEGFTGDLVWVKGGFQAVWREARDCATTEHPSPDEDDPDGTASSSSGPLRTKHLPKAAFSLTSTTAAGAASGSPSFIHAANPFFDTIRQNVELSHGITERIPLRLPRRIRRRISDLPFRWLQDIARRSALRPSPSSSSLESGSESSDDPHESDPDSNDPDVEEGAETLAMQFYRIELAEQRRLRTVMEHHARESEVSAYAAAGQPYTLGGDGEGVISVGARAVGVGAKSAPPTPLQGAFPFSITAGVEKGAKNRYNHIWPFEHARVRLHDGRHQGSHPGPKRDKKVASEGTAGGNTGTPPESSSASASQSATAPKDRNQDMLMSVDKLPVRTPVLAPPSAIQMTPFQHTAFYTPASVPATPFNGPPSACGGVSMTPFRPIPRGTGGNDTYFPTMPPFQPIQETPRIAPIPEDAPMKSPPLRLGALRTGGFLSPPALSMGAMPKSSSPLSTVPRATSPLVLSSSFPPSNREGFNLTLPGGASQVRGPPQFNLAVIPPSIQDKPSEPTPVDDYVNASYVQPLGTRKRYIATQGPLPATFVDFWTLVWEQNVHVIVMLTREIENSMVKCGTYWTDLTYGPLQLQLLSTSPPISPSAHTSSADAGFFLALRERDNNGPKQQPSMIVRTFALSHRGYPGVPPRRVTHLQYLEWPDMNVPEDPRGVLELIKRVERAVQESTPGPSPSGSNSHSGSVSTGSGSLSPSSASGGSPGRSHHERGGDFFASPPLGDAGTRRKSGRRGWRHPELDAKTGVASFALGCAPPVLLHCSAGVGRTGGFIAVDAVLDAVRREISQRREIRARARVGVASVGKGNVNAVEEMERESGTESGRMNLDVDADEGKEMMIGTVPLVMGDRKKARRHHAHKDEGKSGETSSSESLVVHVPVANSPQDTDVGEQTKDVTDTKWQSSTREWAEQVLDQTHSGKGEREFPSLPLSLGVLPAHSRRRSPDSRSNSSGPSTLNSADDSVGSGSGIGNKAGSRSGSASGSGVSGKGSSGTGGAPPSSSVSTPQSGSRSHSGPGSISASNSGSGTNTSSNSGSGFWGSSGVESSGFMGLMRARLRDDSSVTSLSNVGSDFSNDKRRMPLRQPAAVLIGSEDEDAMDVDRPARSVSVPLRETRSSAVAASSQSSASPAVNSNLRTHYTIGSSLVAGFSTPAPPTTSGAARVAFLDPASCASSNPSSDDLSPPREFESGGSADAEGASGKSSQVSPDDSEENGASSGKKSWLKVTETTPAIDQEKTSKSGNIAKPIESTGSTKSKSTGAEGGAGTVSSSLQPVPEVVQHKIPDAELTPSELDQRAAGHAVIDYKLPRQLHQDLSPAPLMAHTNPIWTVVQDMREQRMSLCQSLRQYVFVHAAVIEGALMILDEEREMWGEYSESDESLGPLDGGRRSDDSDIRQTPLMNMDSIEISRMGRNRSTRDRTRSFPPIGGRSSVSSSCGSQIPRTTTSSVVSSSPSKWKRGPSPTELLKEDKSGAVSTAKRPTFHHRMPSKEQTIIASDLTAGAPQVLLSRRMLNLAGGNMTHLGPMAPGQGEPSATAT